MQNYEFEKEVKNRIWLGKFHYGGEGGAIEVDEEGGGGEEEEWVDEEEEEEEEEVEEEPKSVETSQGSKVIILWNQQVQKQ